MSMKTNGIVVTVKQVGKKYVCVDQFGNEHTNVPDWRWRRALKGEFKLIQKFDKAGKVHWKKYYEDYDGPVQSAPKEESSEPVISPLSYTPNTSVSTGMRTNL